MNYGFHADPGVIEGISRTLRNAADDLDRVGSSVPSAPDAGEVTGYMAGALAKLTEAAGEMVVGAAAAGDAVADAGRQYVESDSAAREGLNRGAGGI